MPELPEVETVRRQLQAAVAGRTIRDVAVRFGRRLNVAPDELARILRGRKVVSVGRRAKLLVFNLSGGWTMIAHLKMTGRFLLVPSGQEPEKHTHVVFRLSGGKDLWFDDFRKFGYLRVYPTDRLEAEVFAKEEYGPEPLEKGFTAEKFAACLTSRQGKKVKPALTDQTCIAGIGNIYADEALWRAGVRPTRRIASLKAGEIKALHRGAIGALRQGIKYGGTSSDSYLDVYGRQGRNASRLAAYGREGEACRRCGQAIVKIRLGGRGTHYCPKCQK